MNKRSEYYLQGAKKIVDAEYEYLALNEESLKEEQLTRLAVLRDDDCYTTAIATEALDLMRREIGKGLDIGFEYRSWVGKKYHYISHRLIESDIEKFSIEFAEWIIENIKK